MHPLGRRLDLTHTPLRSVINVKRLLRKQAAGTVNGFQIVDVATPEPPMIGLHIGASHNHSITQPFGTHFHAVNQHMLASLITFAYPISTTHKDELVTNCDRLENMKHASAMPHAFTKQGLAQRLIVNNRILTKLILWRNVVKLQCLFMMIHSSTIVNYSFESSFAISQ